MKQAKYILLIATALFAWSCSKSSSGGGTTTTTIVAPIAIDPTIIGNGSGTYTPTFNGGATVDFVPASKAVMNDWVNSSNPYPHSLNSPTNMKININLAQAANNRYGGTISLSYSDNGINYSAALASGMGKNSSYKGMYDNDRLESDYNYWFSFEKQTVFTGFFEDQYGAITVTLVPQTTTTTSGNDAEPVSTTTYKGYIYYKNFTMSAATAPHSQYRSCWYTYLGPYDCRSNVVQTKCGLVPGSEAGYQLLGSFSNITVSTAFNIN